jgi:alanine racemase
MYSSWAEIDLTMLQDNLTAVRQGLPDGVQPIGVVKANAYGHGLAETVRAAAAAGVGWFATAYLDEAAAVRRVAPQARILILGVVEPGDVPELQALNLTPVVANRDHARALSDAVDPAGPPLRVHLKLDTGMGRIGVLADEMEAFVEEAAFSSGRLDFEGICSHFAAVEPADLSGAQQQVIRFKKAVALAEKELGRKLFRHLSSSRAALYCAAWDFDAVRPGIVLYGYGANDPAGRFQTRPVLQWKTRVMQVKRVPAGQRVGYYGTYTAPRETCLATLAVGYADGYNRGLSNRGDVLLRGRRCRVAGRVSMNWVTVDAGPDTDVCVGDEAVLIGTQGYESIWASELAKICRTIPYEILTGIRSTVPRQYQR